MYKLEKALNSLEQLGKMKLTGHYQEIKELKGYEFIKEALEYSKEQLELRVKQLQLARLYEKIVQTIVRPNDYVYFVIKGSEMETVEFILNSIHEIEKSGVTLSKFNF